MIKIEIPQMGESISEAEIGAFLKSDGAYVSEGEEIVEIETEKVNQALYAPAGGTLHWLVAQGDTLPIGAVIGEINPEGAAAAKREEEKPKPIEQTPQPVQEQVVIKQERVNEDVALGGIRKSKQEFIDQLHAKDKLVETQSPAKGSNRKKMSKIRKTIAARMVGALHEAAMLTTFNEVDMSTIIFLRKKHKESFFEKHGVKLGFMSFFVKAVVDAMQAFPEFNSYIEGDEIVERGEYDIGIAIGTNRGVIVPVVRGADKLSFSEIEQQIVAYATKARGKGLSIGDLEGGGFTITNGGIYGSMLSTPILNPPQVGILGMHKIYDRPIAEGDKVVIRPMMYLALSYDHRMVDGKEAVSFLVRIKERLEDPTGFLFDD